MNPLFTIFLFIFPLQVLAWDCGIVKPNSTTIIFWFILIMILLSFINFLLLKNYYIESKKEESDKKIILQIKKYHLFLIVLIPIISIVLMLWDNAYNINLLDSSLKTKLVIFLFGAFASVTILNKKIYKKFEITSGYWNIFFINLFLFLIISSEILISFFRNLFY